MAGFFRRLTGRAPAQATIAIRTVGTTSVSATRRAPAPLWAETTPPGPPDPQLAETIVADVCVIGLGMAGLAATLRLAEQGADVVGIEAGPVGGGAAIRTAGILRAGLAPFHHDAIERVGRDRAVALYQATLEELEHRRATADPDVRWTGSVRLASSKVEEADCARQLEVMRRDGLPAERYSGPDGDGLLFPHDATVQPAAYTQRLAAKAREAGARLHSFTQAQHVGERDVSGHTGEVRCRAVIVAVDGALEQLVPALATTVRTARVQQLATAPTRQVRVLRPVLARWGTEYWHQLADGRVIVGGAQDIAGDEQWANSFEPTETVQQHLESTLRNRINARDPAITHRWAGLTSTTADRLPRIVRLGSSTVVVGGYNGVGNVLAPMLGRAAADLALGKASPLAELLID
ncbi:MAG: FAD-dependent oxidoreductase [Nitriliruptoraceae bacterium]